MPVPDRQRTLWFADKVLPQERKLRAWLARRMHRRAGFGLEVDDVVQEAYAVLARLDSVEHIVNVRAYLFRTAQSVLLQHIRRSRIVSIEAVAEVERLDAVHDRSSPERHATAHQELQQVGALIADLPDKCRRVFILRKVYGLSQREIAERLGISESTVEKHISKGIRRLARAMTGLATDEPRDAVASKHGAVPETKGNRQ